MEQIEDALLHYFVNNNNNNNNGIIIIIIMVSRLFICITILEEYNNIKNNPAHLLVFKSNKNMSLKIIFYLISLFITIFMISLLD